jgi:hypothetical protein
MFMELPAAAGRRARVFAQDLQDSADLQIGGSVDNA